METEQAEPPHRRTKQTLSNHVYEGLKKDIITCRIEPGEMVFQSELAGTYQVSMAPVREALKRLVQEGLIQSIPSIGHVVSPVTLKDVRDLYDFRRILESAAVRRAAEVATDEQLLALESLAGRIHVLDSVDSHIEWHASNVRFHVQIAAISGNERLVRVVRSVMEEMFRLDHMNLGMRPNTATMVDEHRSIVEALRLRDGGLAVDRAMRSLDQALSLIQRSLSRKGTV